MIPLIVLECFDLNSEHYVTDFFKSIFWSFPHSVKSRPLYGIIAVGKTDAAFTFNLSLLVFEKAFL